MMRTFSSNQSIAQVDEIRSVGEFDEKIQDGKSDVLVYNDDVYYPLIRIEPSSIIMPSVINLKTERMFIEPEVSLYKKAFNKWRSKGTRHALQVLQEQPLESGRDAPFQWFICNLAFYLLLFWKALNLIYVYFYPYSDLPSDMLVQQFSLIKNFGGAIRCISWHPKQHKVALALKNDNIYIYSSQMLTPLLKHPLQKKISAMQWCSQQEDLLAVACEKAVIIWTVNPEEKMQRLPLNYAQLLKLPEGQQLPTPITCLGFDRTGNWLTICCPRSSKLMQINIKKESSFVNTTSTTILATSPNTAANNSTNFSELQPSLRHSSITSMTGTAARSPADLRNRLSTNLPNGQSLKTAQVASVGQLMQEKSPPIEELLKTHRIFGAGITRFIYSPDFSRICVGTTLSGIRIYETYTWSSRTWGEELGDIMQTACWSQPSGLILLFCLKNKPAIYAVIFYDAAAANDVGGSCNKCIKVWDTSEKENDDDHKIGGLIQDMRWDQNAERLVVMFKDNPHHIAVYKTLTKPTLEIALIGFIHGLPNEVPLCFDFHLAFKSGSLLTVCWDSGYVSHIPLQYTPNAKKPRNSLDGQPCSPRSLTSFCMSSPANEHSFISQAPDESSFANMSKLFRPRDSVLSPRRPDLFSSPNKDKD